MWLRKCCCCYCWCARRGSEEKTTSLDDASALIGGNQTQHLEDNQPTPSAFYVPRRHSSFVPSSARFNSTFGARSSEAVHSDGSSSSSEEDTPKKKRGRCWSSAQALDVADAQRRSLSRNRVTSDPVVDGGALAFDRHVLTEIAEVDQGEEPRPQRGHNPTHAEIFGYITFTTIHDKQEQKLTVYLKQATGFPSKGEEPYGTFVKMSLVTPTLSSHNGHNGQSTRLSRTVKKCLNPVYGEEHVFHTHRSSKWKSSAAAHHQYLRLSVIDSERQGRHDAVGHALLPLDEIRGQAREHRLPITPMSLPVPNLGQVLIGIQYVATQSRLTVHVIKARHLRLEAHKKQQPPLHKEALDSFCKVTLTCGGQKVKTCRSRPASGLDPFFDHRTSFVVPPQYLRDAGALVTVVARTALGRQGATLGRATMLGPYTEVSDGTPTQWGRMILEGRSVVQWKNLYL